MGLGQAAVCPWPGDGRCRPCTPEHELARPLPLPPEMLFHRERKGWLLDPPALRWSSLGSQAVRAVGSLQNRPSRGAGRQGCLD